MWARLNAGCHVFVGLAKHVHVYVCTVYVWCMYGVCTVHVYVCTVHVYVCMVYVWCMYGSFSRECTRLNVCLVKGHVRLCTACAYNSGPP